MPEDTTGSLDKKTYIDFNKNRPFGMLPRLCYAPWVNLFFNTQGNAIVCCKNTKLILGNYPENNIHDIWFNKKAELLRTSILQNDLSLGCYKCRESILQKNYSSTTAVFFDKYGMLPLKKYPRVIEFELSNTCNLECVMCSGRVSSAIQVNRERKERMKFPYDDTFVKQLDEFIPHLSEAKFYGGEPFLIPVYLDIWEKIISMKPSVSMYIQTNATILNDRIKHILKKGKFMVGISLDSMNKTNYESIRVNANFEDTMSNVRWLGNNLKNKSVIAAPFRNNWRDIPDVVNFCNSHDFYFDVSTVIHPRELALWSLPKDALKEIVSYYKSVFFDTGRYLQKKNIKVFDELVSSVEYWYQCKEQNESFDNEFSVLIEEQESVSEKIRTVSVLQIKKSATEYKNLLKYHGFSEQELEAFLSIIHLSEPLKESKIPEELVLYYLNKERESGEVIGFFRKSTTEQQQEELLKILKIISREYEMLN
ncbi:MAG: radical SAM protein [Bacteroidales bacterium]|jgi:sulfatase maturation enzyme AslB (radical SAM superfamily)